MSTSKTTAKSDLRGRELIEQVIDPEIREFEDWFRQPSAGGTPLMTQEREVLRSFLYRKYTTERA